MIEFRKMTSSEEGIFKESLSYWLKDMKLIEKNQFLIGEGNWIEVFVVSKEVADSLNKNPKITPYSTGLGIGEIKDGEFILSLSGGEFISKYTKRKAVINDKAEQLFLYKRNILGKSVLDIDNSLNKMDKLLIFNEKEDYLGIGQLLIDKSEITSLEFSNQIVLKNIVDLGWYLRKGK